MRNVVAVHVSINQLYFPTVVDWENIQNVDYFNDTRNFIGSSRIGLLHLMSEAKNYLCTEYFDLCGKKSLLGRKKSQEIARKIVICLNSLQN